LSGMFGRERLKAKVCTLYFLLIGCFFLSWCHSYSSTSLGRCTKSIALQGRPFSFRLQFVRKVGRHSRISAADQANKLFVISGSSMKAALAHLGERQTEVHLSPAQYAISGGTVFDPQKRHLFYFGSQGSYTVVSITVRSFRESASCCFAQWESIVA
jgi:hypothetical protein